MIRALRHPVAAVVVVLATASASAQEFDGRRTRGELEGTTTWSGDVLLEGDVTIPEGSILRIRGGTRIRITASDSLQSGWKPDQVELHVHGQLVVEGSPGAPVHFDPERLVSDDGARRVRRATDYNREPADWHGIVLHDGTDDLLEHVRISGAFAGVSVPEGDPILRGAVFVGCSTGVAVGAAYRTDEDRELSGKAAVRIERSRFTGCFVGLYGEEEGRAEIERCVFESCRYGIGNERDGFSRPMDPPGWAVRRCAFLNNQWGMSGLGLLENSIFWRNAVAYRMTPFHARVVVRIEPVALTNNLYAENGKDFEGEVGLDSRSVEGAPGFVGQAGAGGPLTIDPFGPAVPDALELRPDSPARGVASDGGDLGPTGGVAGAGSGVEELPRWTPAGTQVPAVLVLPLRGKEEKAPGKGPGEFGLGVERKGDWWVAAPTKPGAGLDLRGTFGAGAVGGWVGIPLTSPSGGRVTLEVNGDLDEVVVWWDGEQVHQDDRRRRFGRTGDRIEVDAAAGEHGLLVWVRCWGNRPRLAVAVDGAAAPALAIGEGEAAPPTVRASRLKGRRDRRELLVYLTTDALNWLDSGRSGVVTFRTDRGAAIDGGGSAVVTFERPDRLEIRGIPEPVRNGGRVLLSGLRAPDGREYPPFEFVIGAKD